MRRTLYVLLICIFTSPLLAQVFGPPRRPAFATFANLGAPNDGDFRWCSDCAATAPCTGSGTGAFAYRVGAAWNCNDGSGGSGTPTAITVADTTDSTSFIGMFESATGDLGPKTDAGLTYDASTAKLTASGNIQGSKIVVNGTSANDALLRISSAVLEFVQGGEADYKNVRARRYGISASAVIAIGGGVDLGVVEAGNEGQRDSWGAGMFAVMGMTAGTSVDTVLSRTNPAEVAVGSGAEGNASGSYLATQFKNKPATGTNTAGTNVTITAGEGTGTGRPGDLSLKTAVETTTGTTSQTPRERIHVHAPFRVLSDGAATDVFTISGLTAGSHTGGQIEVTITATDATDYQTFTQLITYGAVNKAGAYTKDVDVVGSSTAVSAGTLTASWGFSDSTDALVMQVTADSSLSSPTIRCKYVLVENTGKPITYPD